MFLYHFFNGFNIVKLFLLWDIELNSLIVTITSLKRNLR
ncbi:hypothetical protein PUND_a3157 [Pseudoalteromonas undina]|nr:hypothetical protein PUND_a3157 [Pseudoalteromonas undina]